jgi:Zn-dependent protease/CBS domain-containing protein
MSIQITKVKGIPIKLHFTLIIAVALITFTLATDFMPFFFAGLSSVEYWIIGIIGAIIMFSSVLIHEIAHSILAQRYGIKVREIVLFVFGGVSDISEELKDYRKEIKMAAAGPAASFILAGIFGLAWWIISSFYLGEPAIKNFIIPILYYGAFLNAVLGVFNLIPAFPSDGGRILRSVLVRRKKDYNEATKSAANIGIAISYVFMAYGFLSLFTGEVIGGIWVLLLGWFLRNGAESYIAQVRLASILSKVQLHNIMNTNIIVVSPDTTAKELLQDYFNKYMRSAFPVVDQENHLLGLVTLARIVAIPEANLANMTARDMMIPRSDLIVMSSNRTAEEALIQMTKRHMGKALVCKERSEELIGMISKTDVLNVEMERQEIADIIKKSRSSSKRAIGSL